MTYIFFVGSCFAVYCLIVNINLLFFLIPQKGLQASVTWISHLKWTPQCSVKETSKLQPVD